MPRDVFISASSADKNVTEEVCSYLESAGLTCWIAPRDILPGQNWGEAIVDAINDSRTMVLIYSGRANQSPQVVREVERAVSKNIPIVPFRIEDAPLSKALEYFISSPHWLDAFPTPVESHFERLRHTVRQLLERSPPREVRPADARIDRNPSLAPRRSGPSLRRLAVVAVLVGIAGALGFLAWRGFDESREQRGGAPTTNTSLSDLPTSGPTTNLAVVSRRDGLAAKIDAEQAWEQVKPIDAADAEDMSFGAKRAAIDRSRRYGDGFYQAGEFADAVERYRDAIQQSEDLNALIAAKSAAVRDLQVARTLAESTPKGTSKRSTTERAAGQQKRSEAERAFKSDDFATARQSATEAQAHFKIAQEEAWTIDRVEKRATEISASLTAELKSALQQYAKAEWAKLDAAVTEAQQFRKNEDFTAAIDAYARAADILEAAKRVAEAGRKREEGDQRERQRLREQHIAGLLKQVAQETAKRNPQGASKALEEVLTLDPNNAAAVQMKREVAAIRPPVFENGLKMKFVDIGPGEFLMGTPPNEPGRRDDEHAHTVRMTKPFYIGVHEVTVGQFKTFIGAGNATEAEGTGFGGRWTGRGFEEMRGGSWRDTGFAQSDDHPVVNVSWRDANAFCKWLGKQDGRRYRLPTEAEWEYACRAGTKTIYPWGTEKRIAAQFANVADFTISAKLPEALAFRCDDKHFFTAPVGTFQPNNWKVCDMIGNVWEWCSDGHSPYPRDGLTIDPAGQETSVMRVLRGGSYDSSEETDRSGHRRSASPGFRFSNIGFRIVAEAH